NTSTGTGGNGATAAPMVAAAARPTTAPPSRVAGSSGLKTAPGCLSRVTGRVTLIPPITFLSRRSGMLSPVWRRLLGIGVVFGLAAGLAPGVCAQDDPNDPKRKHGKPEVQAS